MHLRPWSQEESAALRVLHDGNIAGARTPTRSLSSISSSNYMKRTADLPEDIEVVEIELTSTRMLKLGRQKREETLFIRGPLPLPWFARASQLSGKALHVGVLVWFRSGCEDQRRSDSPLGIAVSSGSNGTRCIERFMPLRPQNSSLLPGSAGEHR